MSTLDTKALRALKAKATPTPWSAWEREHMRGDAVCGVTWAVVSNHYADETPVVFGDDHQWPVIEADAEFVAALVNASEALLAAAEERDTLKRDNARLAGIIADSFGYLPVVPGDAMAFGDLNLTPHVVRVADEYAVLRAQRDALKAEVERLRAALEDVTEPLREGLGLTTDTYYARVQEALRRHAAAQEARDAC